LTPAARAALLAKHEASVLRAELAHEFDVHLSCIYKTNMGIVGADENSSELARTSKLI
jgi:hypothetical protein